MPHKKHRYKWKNTEMVHRKQGVAIILNYLKCIINVCTKFNCIDLVEAGPSGRQYANIALVQICSCCQKLNVIICCAVMNRVSFFLIY
jgi:hypothetical protein